MISQYPQTSETAPYYWKYIEKVSGDDIVDVLEKQTERMLRFYEGIPADKWDYAYAAGKWTLKGTLRHLIDAERVFTYRLLRFLRQDPTSLPGFDQDAYMAQLDVDKEPIADLLKEWSAVRESTLTLIRSVPAEGWDRRGMASNASHTVRAIAYVIAGHELHHGRLTVERYL